MLSRIWNGRLGGVPMCALILWSAGRMRVADRLAAALWRGNLGRMAKSARIATNVDIRQPSRVALGERAIVSRGTRIETEFHDSDCVIGDDSEIGLNVFMDFSGGLFVGKGVVVSEGATILTHSHGLDPKSQPVKTPLYIEDGVWIGSFAMIVEGVGRIGRGAVVAAGAVVTKEVPPSTVVGGVPARALSSSGVRPERRERAEISAA